LSQVGCLRNSAWQKDVGRKIKQTAFFPFSAPIFLPGGATGARNSSYRELLIFSSPCREIDVALAIDGKAWKVVEISVN